MDVLNKVLIATDGSARGEIAIDLAAAIEWPVPTEVEVLEVNVPAFQAAELPAEAIDSIEREDRARIDRDLAFARCRLVRAAPMTQTAMRRGRAASEIVREAERIRADLLIVGSRGRGPIATMLLGSVAAEVVDRVRCPVLIARVPHLRKMVVADDGSAAGALAMKIASTWPIFKGLSARVVSVAPVDAITGEGPIAHEGADRDYAFGVDALRTIHASIAEDCAAQLNESGLAAEAQMRCGDPADEIISAALESEADLIVIGSRGQSGLERIVMGSVARNVLTHAPMSVLIAHALR